MKPAPLSVIAGIAAELILQEAARPADPLGVERIIGRSSAAIDLRASLRKLALAAEGHPPPGVLITGPRGSGKALAAQALYELAREQRGTVAVVNCTLPDDLLDRAFASSPGTLILHNINALSELGQAKVAHEIEERPSLWVIATSSQNLAVLEKRGSFRSDLLYRIQVGWIDLLPLQDHTSDILPLAEEFARRTALRFSRPRPRFNGEARVRLLQHDWPGNVAELENCIERAVIQSNEGMIDAADIRIIDPSGGSDQLVPNLPKLEEMALVKALRTTGGNVSKAADLLGISRDTLRYRMEKFGISRR